MLREVRHRANLCASTRKSDTDAKVRQLLNLGLRLMKQVLK